MKIYVGIDIARLNHFAAAISSDGDFVRDFRVAKISDRKYINLSRGTAFIKESAELCNLPLTSYFLNDGDIKKMLSHRF